MNPKIIQVFYHANGVSPYNQWLYSLKDTIAVQKILTRIDRLTLGNPGDHKSVGLGVFELRIHFGPGYRIYFALDGIEIILLLCGGDKSSQNKDIQNAHRYWMEYKRRLG